MIERYTGSTAGNDQAHDAAKPTSKAFYSCVNTPLMSLHSQLSRTNAAVSETNILEYR